MTVAAGATARSDVRSSALRREVFAFLAMIALAACTATKDNQSTDVSLVEPFETVPASSLNSLLRFATDRLARIDPSGSKAEDTQVLSLFGREDLIAASSTDYKASDCPPRVDGSEVIEAIEQGARRTSIVIVNESHERSEHRGFTTMLAERLKPLGYDILAMEALSNPLSETPDRFRPPFLARPGQPYLEADDGFYLGEAAFGRLGRRAKALGYRLLPYESGPDGLGPSATREQQIAFREEAQASNLAAIVRANPDGKLLVHVGYSHARETPTAEGERWMATRLKQKTGVDPLTISQTTCRGGGRRVRLARLPVDEPAGSFDLIVDHPTARFVRGRPAWRIDAGDRPVAIPSVLVPGTGWRVIEARPAGEPNTSVPIDRVAIRTGDAIALMLPPGRYAIRAIDVPLASPARD